MYKLNKRQQEILLSLKSGEWSVKEFHNKKTCARRRNDPQEMVDMGAAWEAYKYEIKWVK